MDRPTVLTDPSGLFPCLSCGIHALTNAAKEASSFAIQATSAALTTVSHATETAAGFIEHSNLDIATGAAAAFCVAAGVETLGAGCAALGYLATTEAVGRSAYSTGVVGPGRAEWSRFGSESAGILALLGISKSVSPAAAYLFERHFLTRANARAVERFGESSVFGAGWVGSNIK
jgi:hypothetical protein